MPLVPDIARDLIRTPQASPPLQLAVTLDIPNQPMRLGILPDPSHGPIGTPCMPHAHHLMSHHGALSDQVAPEPTISIEAETL